MGLLDSILGAVSGKSGAPGEANPLIGIVSGLLGQSGGLQGLANKFAQSGQGNASTWKGMGENQSVSTDQIQNALGSEQVNAIATRMGVDPAVASTFLADYLPKIVDKLTPAGKIDPSADHQQGLAALLPSLLQVLAANHRATSPLEHSGCPSSRFASEPSRLSAAGLARSILYSLCLPL